MKKRNINVERLFAAARTAPTDSLEPMPEYLKTRVLAHAFAEPAANDLLSSLSAALRLGLGLALATMIACIAWNYRDLGTQPDDAVELANMGAHLDLQL